jgi:hypothetical protein
MNTDAGSADPSVVLLVSTHMRAAHFVRLVREAIKEFWPEHPPLRFLTDGGAEGPDVIVSSEHDFVPLLAAGLQRIRSEYPAATHVFHMLEDHCPLRRCDTGSINSATAEVVSRRLAAASFVTYDWPWSHTDDDLDGDGLVCTWPRIDIARFDRESFAVVPQNFFRYFQVQPTLWRIDYLERILREAAERGIVDPWRFEALRLPEVEQHYISSYRWPTVHHGFLAQGKVNDAAIEYIGRGSAVGLRKALIAGLGNKSEAAYLTATYTKRLKGRLLRLLGRVRNA